MIFHIGAMPRSGTAWISSVLNLCPDIMCVHEPIDLNVPVPENSYNHAGQSGSHLLIPECIEMDVDLSIYIDRNPVDSFKSTTKYFSGIKPNEWNETVVKNGSAFKAIADIVIPFESLFTVEAVKYVWESITDHPFDKDKVEAYLNMNVQRHSMEYNFNARFMDNYLRTITERDR